METYIGTAGSGYNIVKMGDNPFIASQEVFYGAEQMCHPPSASHSFWNDEWDVQDIRTHHLHNKFANVIYTVFPFTLPK